MEPKKQNEGDEEAWEKILAVFINFRDHQWSFNERLVIILIAFFLLNALGFAFGLLTQTAVFGESISAFSYIAVIIALGVLYTRTRK